MTALMFWSTLLALLTGIWSPAIQPHAWVGFAGPARDSSQSILGAPSGEVQIAGALNPTVSHEEAFELQGCVSNLHEPPLRYQIGAVLDWDAHMVEVVAYVMFRNETDTALAEIVFNIETNREEDIFTLNALTMPSGKYLDDYTLNADRLVVTLPSPLPPDCEITLVMNYSLQIPPIVNGYREGHLGYWGYSARQVNLGLWVPLVAAFDETWTIPEPHWLGEHFLLRAADFAVELKVENAPEGVQVAGPGQMSQPADHIWRFELTNAREVALSLSDQFATLHTSTDSGVDIDLFYFPDPDAETLDTPRYALNTSVDAVMLFEDLFGTYPYGRLVVVEGDFPDGMEFSGLVFVSKDWFVTWRGDPNDWLTIITVHEIAHQWWYALVANDQAHYPYLDEALAIYSEVLFFEHYYPEHLDWWWDFRVLDYEPTGYVDTPIYEFYSVRGYINAVYLRGARMMQLLRDDIGDEQFFAWLQAYALHNAGEIAGPLDFWGVLPPDAYRLTELTRQDYLAQPDVLPPRDEIP